MNLRSPVLRSRALALLILASTIVLVWLATIRPLMDWISVRRDSIVRDTRLLQAYQRTALDRSKIEGVLQLLKAQQASIPGLVTGNTPELAAAVMQSEIKRIVESNGGELRSVQNLPVAKAEEFEKIDIHYELSVPLSNVAEIMYQLETHSPYFFLDNVHFRSVEGLSSDTPGQGSHEQKLTVHWNIHGYRWVGAK